MYKVLLRWYWVPAHIAHANPTSSDCYFRGCGHRGDVLHTWWTCPRPVGFWPQVFGLLYSLFYLNTRKKAKFAFLHCPILGLFARQQKLSSYLFIAAKRTIAQVWKKPTVPFQGVRDHFMATIRNEQMSSILKHTDAKFLKILEPWFAHAFPDLPLTSVGRL